MGRAILDFQRQRRAEKLRVCSSMFEEDEMPVKHLFRTGSEMPEIERMALAMARGKVLDVGAGAGCHALSLQEKGFCVRAIDISPLACEAMQERGIMDTECIDLFDTAFTGQYDTILMLMNGTGIAGKVERLPLLFEKLKALLATGGQILIDSTDLRYIYEDDNGNFDIDPENPYYGEVDYKMIYKDIEGETFDWLYVDYPLLAMVAQTCGLNAELVMEGEYYDYLAKLTIQ